MKAKTMANDTGRSYSIRDAALAMAVSEATLKAYKATLIKAFENDLSRVLTEARSLNEYGLEQLGEVQKFHRLGIPDGYVAMIQKEFPQLANSMDTSKASEAETVETRVMPTSNMSSIQLPGLAMPASGSDGINLARWQGQEILAIENPAAIALDIKSYARSISNALRVDLERKTLQVREQQQAIEEIDQVSADLERETLLYEVRQELLAQRLDETTQQLVKKVTKLQSLGKPDAATSQP